MHVTAEQYLLGQTPSDQPLTDFGLNLVDVAQAYAQYNLANKCLDINLQRAQQGQPPLDCSTYGTGVQVGISSGTQQFLLIAVAVIAGALILPKLLR